MSNSQSVTEALDQTWDPRAMTWQHYPLYHHDISVTQSGLVWFISKITQKASKHTNKSSIKIPPPAPQTLIGGRISSDTSYIRFCPIYRSVYEKLQTLLDKWVLIRCDLNLKKSLVPLSHSVRLKSCYCKYPSHKEWSGLTFTLAPGC